MNTGYVVRPAALAREASFLTRRSYLVSRRSQALIFLLARYASRFTNDGLLEIRFTRNALWRDLATAFMNNPGSLAVKILRL